MPGWLLGVVMIRPAFFYRMSPTSSRCWCCRPTSRGRQVGCRRAGVDALVLAALGERPAAAEQDRELVVEVVAEPVGGPGAGLEPQGLPGLPQGGEPGDRLGVPPPLRAPPEFPAERAPVDGDEVPADPVLDAGI